MEAISIKASKRDANVKNVYRKSIREGYVPAVLYNKTSNIPISLPRIAFTKEFLKAKPNTIFNIDLDGSEKHAFIKDYSEELSKAAHLKHVDFYLIEDGQTVNIKIPLKITGLAKGITLGGLLEVFVSQIKVKCESKSIPDFFEIDVTDMGIDDLCYIKDVKIPDGVTVLDSPTKAIAAVHMSSKGASKAGDEGTTESVASTEEAK